MIVVIDNYDSFTYNLVQILGEIAGDNDIRTIRNNKVTVDEIESWRPDGIVISPGPGYPGDAGISVDTVRRLGKKVPILGVCLGHQAIAHAFGGEIVPCSEIMHGKTSSIFHDSTGIFEGVEVPFVATRYHSLVVRRESLPEIFKISAQTSNGIIMGIRHKYYPIEGIQFHPESILTTSGKKLLANFLNRMKKRRGKK
ncbi:MAG TPA: aminodeoxychorismate/anthranilate synthase component II [Deltaproteobacteria bacterium]|nr:MAG: aminodeoxychorismate/anthranilate synthase component II [Deltaproteobacteria bacterium]RLB10108.1 MAG: aminodeoxychorismate/anthranilate synthase component II [Deltaproteobacteria bacterium]HDM76246.1 aminodeoxychorismate/anthranilate synthase component II [Deltaproteobacteria bacterium]HEC31864.1 aminodeoxychorismate/anthranilate synthase component II [Deltaproteobacteria bacterium]